MTKPKPKLPAIYSEAKAALAKCASIDECKDYADKAKALAGYAAQVEDESLLNYAKRIRARAVRRQGELLKEIEADRIANKGKGLKGGRLPSNLSRRKAGHDAGLSDAKIKSAIRVANVPEDEFEQQVESLKPPTVQALAKQGTTKRPKTMIDGDETARKAAIERLTDVTSYNLVKQSVEALDRHLPTKPPDHWTVLLPAEPVHRVADILRAIDERVCGDEAA
jgi:hypothetical protein